MSVQASDSSIRIKNSLGSIRHFFDFILSIIDQTSLEKLDYYFDNIRYYRFPVMYSENIKNSSLKYLSIDGSYSEKFDDDQLKNILSLVNQTNIEYLRMPLRTGNYTLTLSEAVQALPKLSFLSDRVDAEFPDFSFFSILSQHNMLGLNYQAMNANDLNVFCQNIKNTELQFFRIGLSQGYDFKTTDINNCITQLKTIKGKAFNQASDFMRSAVCSEMFSILSGYSNPIEARTFNSYLPLKKGVNYYDYYNSNNRGGIAYLNPDFCSSSGGALKPLWPFELIGPLMKHTRNISSSVYCNLDSSLFLLLSGVLFIQLLYQLCRAKKISHLNNKRINTYGKFWNNSSIKSVDREQPRLGDSYEGRLALGL